MKKTNYCLLIAWLFSSLLNAQSTLLRWDLNNVRLGTPTTYSTAVEGLPFDRGNGLSRLTFSSSDVSADHWALTDGQEAEVDFYEFGLSAKAGQTLALSELSFKEKRSSDGPKLVQLTYSRDDFETEYLVTSLQLPDNIGVRSQSIPLDISTDDRETLRFRLYAFGSESANGSWAIRSTSLRIRGEVFGSCTAPASLSTISVGTVTENSISFTVVGGAASSQMVVISPSDEVMTYPYTGKAYSSDSGFGDGEQIGDNTYVVHTTTGGENECTITGLEPGEAYQIAVFDYDAVAMCYTNLPNTTEVVTLCLTEPKALEQFKVSELDNQISFAWEKQSCVDDYLLVAAKSPITGILADTPPDELFGSEFYGVGTRMTELGDDVFALYFGNNARTANARALRNGETYYFAFYTYFNGKWSPGVTVQGTPQPACVPDTREAIWFNEVHYRNRDFDQDEGVEVAGRAGINLQNYTIRVFEFSNPPQVRYREIMEFDLTGTIDDEGEGFGAVWFPIPDLPDKRGMLMLMNNVTEEVVFAIYHFAPFGIAADPNPVVNPNRFPDELLQLFAESETDPPGLSLQFVGESLCPLDLEWQKLPHSRGILNPGQAALPVELIALAAEPVGQRARVFWSTAIEQNSDYFAIEHSIDGRTYRNIGYVKAAGTTQERQDYEFWDNQPNPGQNYYRLRQVDYDGTTYDKGVVSVQFDGDKSPGLNVFPNPVEGVTTVVWTGPAQELLLSDGHGRRLLQVDLSNQVNGGSYTLDLSEYPMGMYYVRTISQDEVRSFPILKQ